MEIAERCYIYALSAMKDFRDPKIEANDYSGKFLLNPMVPEAFKHLEKNCENLKKNIDRLFEF